jgi:hypothetical protein
MNRPIIKIHNVELDEIIEREMNDIEFAQYEADQVASEQAKAEAEAKATARQALLNRLGISEEEARLLLG